VIDTLVQTARPYIYTTAAPPMLAETLRVALRIIRDDAARREHLIDLVAQFRQGARDCRGGCFHRRRRFSRCHR
jgi:8-amino-7-oxononanoate synthase